MNDSTGINWVALSVLIFFFVVVAVAGFWAARWRRPDSMESLEEGGLGGRSFATWVTWFLLGGDLCTAYTFVAVPAAMFAAMYPSCPMPGMTSSEPPKWAPVTGLVTF